VLENPLTHVPVVAGPAYAERVRQLPSRFTATLRAEPENRVNFTAVAVTVSGDKVGYLPPELARHYFPKLKDGAGVECQGRRAPVSEHDDTGVDLLLDLSGVPREP
jgi:hypothetical protein